MSFAPSWEPFTLNDESHGTEGLSIGLIRERITPNSRCGVPPREKCGNLVRDVSQEQGTMKTNDSSASCPKCGAEVPTDFARRLCPKCLLAGAATALASDATLQEQALEEDVPSLDAIREAFPQLEICELIGRGGMGYVFKARQTQLDRLVALKLLTSKLAHSPQFTERFNREGRFLARLNHPNIVSVFDFGRSGEFHFLIMEYVEGLNLRQAMQAGRFSPAEALAIVPRICEALQYAHEQGVLHRDIKPENILLDAKGRVKLADFGIAKLTDEGKNAMALTRTGAALGTPHYMAPEQLENPTEVDHRADIYSLGVVFYEMLTGELPIGRFAAPSTMTPVHTRVDDVVFRTLEKDRAKRFQSAGEVKTQVEHLTQGGQAVPPPPQAQEGPVGPTGTQVMGAPPVPDNSGRALLGAALAAAGLVGLITTLAASGSGRMAGEGARPEVWLALSALAGIAGTALGWLALQDIRNGRGSRGGLPWAVWGALAWPLSLLMGLAVIPALYALRATAGHLCPSWVAWALVAIPLAGILTFALWAVYTTVQWVNGQTRPERRGVLKWIFAALLVSASGFAAFSINRNYHEIGTKEARAARSPWSSLTRILHQQAAPSAPPEIFVGGWPRNPQTPAGHDWVRFTILAVETRTLTDGRWLAMDFSTLAEGDSAHAFIVESKGYQTISRKTESVAAAESPMPVRHQRIEWQLPPELSDPELFDFRDQLAKQGVLRSVMVTNGATQPLFRLPIAGVGELKVSLTAISPRKAEKDGAIAR